MLIFALTSESKVKISFLNVIIEWELKEIIEVYVVWTKR